ncbi:MAG: hypothetical protein ACRDHF_04180 [Tepidiformaceae bacterium]
MTVDDREAELKTPGPPIRAALVAGPDAPQPVWRTALPTSGGGPRQLGLPTVLDRFIAHALLPVLPEEWDPPALSGATAVARSAGPTRRWSRCRRTGETATRGWWIATWSSAATGCTTTW